MSNGLVVFCLLKQFNFYYCRSLHAVGGIYMSLLKQFNFYYCTFPSFFNKKKVEFLFNLFFTPLIKKSKISNRKSNFVATMVHKNNHHHDPLLCQNLAENYLPHFLHRHEFVIPNFYSI